MKYGISFFVNGIENPVFIKFYESEHFRDGLFFGIGKNNSKWVDLGDISICLENIVKIDRVNHKLWESKE